MNKENIYFNIGFILVFGFLIATINSIVFNRFSSDIKNLASLERQLEIKESFASQKSPKELSERMNQSVPSQLNKSQITTKVAQLARESNIQIPSITIEENKKTPINLPQETEATSAPTSTTVNEPLINTLKSANIELSVTGGRREVYGFIQKLSQENPYMEVTDLSLSFEKGLGSLEGDISIITYYTGI